MTMPHATDVERLRERRRLVRVAVVAVVVLALVGWTVVQVRAGRPLLALPELDPLFVMPAIFFALMTLVAVVPLVVSGRSPHTVVRPEDITLGFDDVVGIGPVRDEVRRTLDVFLSGRTFRDEMGGTPRRGVLFEGPPGTGKTHMAKAMAAEAGVPFLFVSATSFQSMYYGATSRKIRAYFRALRKAARAEGGAIGFIEEIDAIAMARGGMSMTPAPAFGAAAHAVVGHNCGGLTGLPMSHASSGSSSAGVVTSRSMVSEGVGGVVNELLVQLQSFDTPTWQEKTVDAAIDAVNLLLPSRRRIPHPRRTTPDILVVAATNRADSLDPALLRPGRFDLRLAFEAPDKAGRRELVDHFLAGKSHDSVLDEPQRRDALAGMTQGYTPAMLERLMDEALVNAVRRKATAMSWLDLEHARLATEVGTGLPVGYTDHEERLIATHEAGHAVLAWLVAPHRRLEVLTIIKRAGSLGLLAHGDREDVYTRSRRELEALMCIAFGGQAVEDLFFGDVSTGPGGDLTYATNVAAQMVGQAGMADTLISFSAVQGSAISDQGLVGRVLGDTQGRAMVETLLGRQRARAGQLLAANRHLVEALRDALVERHELVGDEITAVLEAAQAAHAEQAVAVVDVRAGATVPTQASWWSDPGAQ
jgi:cell division protease FtsH